MCERGRDERAGAAPADERPESASGRTTARGWSGRGRGPLGSFVILDHIEKARRLGLPPIYLGYWVEGSKKMGYKAGYLPQERLGLHGWARVERYGGCAPDGCGASLRVGFEAFQGLASPFPSRAFARSVRQDTYSSRRKYDGPEGILP